MSAILKESVIFLIGEYFYFDETISFLCVI